MATKFTAQAYGKLFKSERRDKKIQRRRKACLYRKALVKHDVSSR